MIVDAALALIDEAGLAELSLRALAGRLGVSPMALYRYFEDKDDLLDAMAAAVLVESASTPPSDEPWDLQLAAAMRELHDALAAHPGLMELVLTRYVGGEVDALRDRLFAIVERAGWREQESLDVLRAVTSYVLGSVVVTHRRRREAGRPESPESFEFGLTLMMDSLRAHWRNA
jgi:AcrR family transcriptional regulator